MHLKKALLLVARGPRPESFQILATTLDPSWVAMALTLSGVATIRRRKLPMEAVIWLVLGMALFSDRSIPAVYKHLSPVLLSDEPKQKARRNRQHKPRKRAKVSSAAAVKARKRLGVEPMRQLFLISARHWVADNGEANRWKGLGLYGVDGTTLLVPDTPENDEFFGRPGSRRGKSGYPQLRLVALMALRSRVLAGAAFGPYRDGEQSLARQLWEQVPDHSLVILDRGFVNYGEFARIPARGVERHWLARGKRNTSWETIERFGPGDLLVELKLSAKQRREDPSLPRTIQVRAISYQLPGREEHYLLLTSLTDPKRFAAEELVRLYHERWEIELGYGEIKTETLERYVTLRSKSPEQVLQEVWGLLVAYNLVRVMMAQAAGEAGVAPARISYRNSLIVIRDFLLCAWLAAPGNLPKLYRLLREELADLVLPKRRPRKYPRVVKIKMSNYKRKQLE